MTLKQNFCSSPWFHMRIRNNGDMSYCRWAWKTVSTSSIKDQTPQQFFTHTMEPIRQAMLAGHAPTDCQACQQMEKHGKVSGRQKQLLKTGIRIDQFDKTMLSSPWLPVFKNGVPQMPQDWQIDLGNYCNSACVMCGPASSSRLAQEFKQLKLISSLPPANWSDDSALTQTAIDALLTSSKLKYIHFIGGETLITPAFEKILLALIQAGKNNEVTIGFTTNLTVWSQNIVDLLTQFESVHLGVSIECFSAVNDYIRWPARIETVTANLERWVGQAQHSNWLVQLRTTPTVLSVHDLISVYDYAWQHNIAVESCNFLQDPAHMRAATLPMAYRQPIIDNMKQWLANHSVSDQTVVNIRNPHMVKSQIWQDLASYVEYLNHEPDESYRLGELVTYLKQLESMRGNQVLDYLPQYEKLFRSAGYAA